MRGVKLYWRWNFWIWSFKLIWMLIYILVFVFYYTWVSSSGIIVISRAAISRIYNTTTINSCFQVSNRYSWVFILTANIWKLWEVYSCRLFWISFAWKLIYTHFLLISIWSYVLASLKRGFHSWCSLILSIIDNHYNDIY